MQNATGNRCHLLKKASSTIVDLIKKRLRNKQPCRYLPVQVPVSTRIYRNNTTVSNETDTITDKTRDEIQKIGFDKSLRLAVQSDLWIFLRSQISSKDRPRLWISFPQLNGGTAVVSLPFYLFMYSSFTLFYCFYSFY